ncbi:MAG TPA: BF3164 family lipoprotein [Candidatus Mcinerneyibacterium sp.]|nr:BF3164 family lipoprotein [Candidatus Mcinerneyibacterium sp.]
MKNSLKILSILISVFILILTISSCKTNNRKEVLNPTTKFSIEKIKNPTMINSHKNHIYISDFMDCKIYKYRLFNSKLEFINKFLKKGTGPGEIGSYGQNRAFYVDIKNDKIFILDEIQSKLNIYDNNLNFIDEIRFQLRANRIHFLNDDEILISKLPLKNNKFLLKYNMNNKKYENLNLSIEKKKNMIKNVFASRISFATDSNNLYIGYQFKNTISKYSFNKNKIVKNIELIPGKNSEISSNMRENKVYTSRLRVYNNNIYILYNKFKNIGEALDKKDKLELKSFLYVFDKNLNLKTKYGLKNKINDFTISNEKLITITRDNIYIYNLKMNN